MSTYKTQVNKSIRYDEAKILGQGSFCIVYEAEYKRVGPDGKKETIVCALKMLKPNLNKTDPESQGAIKYFEQECKLLTSITHPNLVKAYEYDCENPAKKWVILEKCDMSLNQFLESIGVRILCEERVREFAISILCGLKELHSKRIVHRDLKLENILIDRNKLLKIADFGLAKQSTQGSKIALQSFLGTPDYMAPEIYETRTNGQVSYNQTVDIYAFGHVIFTLCSGAFRSDYNGGQGPTMDGRHARLFDPETYNYPASFSPLLIDLLKKCWNPDPNRRPSAVDVLSHPWIGLTSPNLSPQAAAKMSMLSTTKLIQNESNPCEYYWKPISEYMQYAVCTKVKELSLKLHNRYRHIVKTYELSPYWNHVSSSLPEFNDVKLSYQAVMAMYLYNNMSITCKGIRNNVDLTSFDHWQKDKEFVSRCANLATDMGRYSEIDGSEATQSQVAQIFLNSIERAKDALHQSSLTTSRAMAVFITTFGREVTNLLTRLFKITIEFDIEPNNLKSLVGITLTNDHRVKLRSLIEEKLTGANSVAFVDFGEPSMSLDRVQDFEACGSFIDVNMFLQPTSDPIFADLAMSTTG